MKQYILKVAKDLEEGIISEDRAGKLLLGLFGVSGSSVPLTVNKVSEITQEISKETWIAAKGNDEGWQNWWNNRCKININSKKKDNHV